MKSKLFLMAVGLSLVLFSYSFAQVPQMINYQGKLTKASGAVLDTTVQMVFSIYADSSGTTLKWTETQGAVKVEKGIFNVLLGSTNPIPDSVFDGSVRYLGVTVGADPEITPRKPMVSVPYAYKSGSGGGGNGWTDDGNVVRLTTSTDSVGIGTTTPREQIEITGNLRLPITTSTTGIIKVGNDRFIHVYGTNNTFVGRNAGNLTMSGTFNTANGTSALYYNTTGHSNTANGYSALFFNTTGFENTANGVYALYYNTTGHSNTANGHLALFFNTTGNSNTANGKSALASNTTGFGNTANGLVALSCNTTGNSNTAIGVAALNRDTTGSYNTALGYAADVSLGNLTNATAIGAYAVVSASNALVLGGTGEYAVNVGIGTTSPQGALDVTSTTGALIVPRMTTAQRDALTAVNGMIIYNTSTNQFEFYEKGAWVTK